MVDKKSQKKATTIFYNIERVNPDVKKGLTDLQVEQRIKANMVNVEEAELTPSISKIIKKNTITLFNIVNIFLAVIIVLIGNPENTLFLCVAVANTMMGIFQEIRSKKTLDKLAIIAEAKAVVIREGKEIRISQNDLVLDDIVYLKAGDQVGADAIVIEPKGLEVDESLLTGEMDKIVKRADDKILSGSFITGGQAYVRVIAVGSDNYATVLTAKAKEMKKHKSRLIFIINKIIQILTFVIFPLGALLFYAQYSNGQTIESSIMGTSAAIISMIPNGLVLLTSVTLTVGTLILARKKVLVQSLPSIETLARVDMLCLDKTGTITSGMLVYERLECVNEIEHKDVNRAIAELMGALRDSNATAEILKKEFGQSHEWNSLIEIPFNSERKWSGVTFQGVGSYIIGAPNIVLKNISDPIINKANQLAEEGYRVLCLVKTLDNLQSDCLPNNLESQALIVLSDQIRPEAIETFGYFADEGVGLKVISGDNPRTVSTIAKKAGIINSESYIDMSTIHDETDFKDLASQYTVFGHVSPVQKQRLIQGLQGSGYTTCMTGDGVNDILAMKEADCSVAMVNGSDAARGACDFVLMDSNFSSMVQVLKEGRRVINNIERVTSLYIVNTLYAVIFALIYTFIALPYPYLPLQMTPINALTVGIPSFFLALRVNYNRPEHKFMSNIVEHSLPAAITIIFNTLYIQLASMLFDIPVMESATMIVFLIGVVGFYLLFRLAKPFNIKTKILFLGLVSAFITVFVFYPNYFMLTNLFNRNVFFYVPLLYFSYYIHDFLGNIFHVVINWFNKRIK